MENQEIVEFSARLKEIARDLSFLGHPRFPVNELRRLFPQHSLFIAELEDVSVPFPVNVAKKRTDMDVFVKDLALSGLTPRFKEVFNHRIEDYRLLLSMMESFGTFAFYENSRKLYGSSLDPGKEHLGPFFRSLNPFCSTDPGGEKLHGEAAMDYLRTRMSESFSPGDFEVKASTSLLSDSSAGRRVLKLNPFKAFTKMQLEVFLVHEGWVHLGTAINGAAQKEHLWLSTWAPRTTYLQEGLAILTELLTGTMTFDRWNKVYLRHMATGMAEKGSSVTEVYDFLKTENMEALDAFKLSLRVFRGVPLTGGAAFTKELLYVHGLADLLRQIKALEAPLASLWYGKMSFAEHALVLTMAEFNRPLLKNFPRALDEAQAQEKLLALTKALTGSSPGSLLR